MTNADLLQKMLNEGKPKALSNLIPGPSDNINAGPGNSNSFEDAPVRGASVIRGQPPTSSSSQNATAQGQQQGQQQSQPLPPPPPPEPDITFFTFRED